MIDNNKPWHINFLENIDTGHDKKVVEEIVSSLINWKQDVWNMRWQEELFKDGKCRECGSPNIEHRQEPFPDCCKDSNAGIVIWATECRDCNVSYKCLIDDDGELLEVYFKKGK